MRGQGVDAFLGQTSHGVRSRGGEQTVQIAQAFLADHGGQAALEQIVLVLGQMQARAFKQHPPEGLEVRGRGEGAGRHGGGRGVHAQTPRSQPPTWETGRMASH